MNLHTYFVGGVFIYGYIKKVRNSLRVKTVPSTVTPSTTKDIGGMNICSLPTEILDNTVSCVGNFSLNVNGMIFFTELQPIH